VSWLSQKNPELDVKTLTLPLALEKEHPPQLYSFVVVGSLAFLIFFVVWASVTSILEVTHASGEIQPAGQVKTVQHLHGGYVDELFVTSGQKVVKGQSLLSLRPTATKSDRDQIEIRMAALRMSLAALDAQTKGLATPNFGADAQDYPELAKAEFEAFGFEKARIKREQAKLASQLARRGLEYNAAISEKKSVETRFSISQERYDSLVTLGEQGFAPRKDVLAAEADLEDARARQFALEAKIASAAELSSEANFLLEEQRAAIQSKLAKQISTGAAELAGLEQKFSKFQELVDGLVLTSPIDGYVHELAYNNAGAVVRPGEIIATIVPSERNLIAEVKVKPKDIGHITVGADAKVSVSTFDPFAFGTLTGKVQSISASTFNEDGSPYFKVHVALNEQVLVNNGISYPIQTGMGVTADILTGEKSLTRYLLKPVFRSVDQAFSER